MDSLKSINEDHGITVITNLHTLDTARHYCGRIVGMRAGRVVFDGSADELTEDAAREIYGDDGLKEAFSEAITSTSLASLRARARGHASLGRRTRRLTGPSLPRPAAQCGGTEISTGDTIMLKTILLGTVALIALGGRRHRHLCSGHQGVPHRHPRRRERSRPSAQFLVPRRPPEGDLRLREGLAVPRRRL